MALTGAAQAFCILKCAILCYHLGSGPPHKGREKQFEPVQILSGEHQKGSTSLVVDLFKTSAPPRGFAATGSIQKSFQRLPIYFYIPQSAVFNGNLPTTIDRYWPWISAQEHIWWGPFDWTLQTYLHLKSNGCQCELTRKLPSEGIVIAHRVFFRGVPRPGPRQLMVCLLADKTPYPYAQFHLIQNPLQSTIFRPKELWPNSYVTQWPQPSLIPRAQTRGERFETAVFFGSPPNIAGELCEPAWSARVRDIGLSWHLPPRRSWHDYSAVDVIVAVRSFKEQDYLHKPAAKLYNAWLAGVPAILGRESAYLAERRSDLDYLEATSVESAVAALIRLRDDRDLRRAMVENGRRRAKHIGVSKIVKQWEVLLANEVATAYTEWCGASDNARATFLVQRELGPNDQSATLS
jgi:hypothetical protein